MKKYPKIVFCGRGSFGRF